ncbi:hypothetical protein BSCG_00419 [Bacteroides sp. 2_2_4]|jgi:hypothetical protein|nr:hypothetical protein BSCG_00419 [Bacteroides sp. 2_2_4]
MIITIKVIKNMKRYNLSEIMRTAHRTYKYVGKKQGKTFGEVLKSTWRLAKLDVARQEADAKRKAEEEKRQEALKSSKPAEVVRYNFIGEIYNRNSRGYMSSQYCGD